MYVLFFTDRNGLAHRSSGVFTVLFRYMPTPEVTIVYCSLDSHVTLLTKF